MLLIRIAIPQEVSLLSIRITPSSEMVRKLVDQISHGDFDEKTIEVKEWLECDAKVMRNQGAFLHKFSWS